MQGVINVPDTIYTRLLPVERDPGRVAALCTGAARQVLSPVGLFPDISSLLPGVCDGQREIRKK